MGKIRAVCYGVHIGSGVSVLYLSCAMVRMRYLGKIEGESGKRRTVEEMVRLIQKGSEYPEIRALAAMLTEGKETRLQKAVAIHNWVQRFIRYRKDPKGVELLQDPRLVLEEGEADCDEHVILSCALYRAAGIPCKIMTLSVVPGRPDPHAVALVQTEHGWLISDTTRKGSLGHFDLARRIIHREVFHVP